MSTDDRLVFLHMHSAGTVANLAGNPAVEINVVDPIRREGWRFAGSAPVHTPRSSQFTDSCRIETRHFAIVGW